MFLVGYSYTKRFTWLSHWILGFTDGAAAAGAWIAVRGTMEPPAWLLWLAVTVWIAGFDLLYACQDVEFDRREGLHSVPARFGIAAALRAARVSHVLTALALAAAGWALGLGVLYWVGWVVVVGLLVYEHSLVSATDLSRLDMAFFNVNGYISVDHLRRRGRRPVVLGQIDTHPGRGPVAGSPRTRLSSVTQAPHAATAGRGPVTKRSHFAVPRRGPSRRHGRAPGHGAHARREGRRVRS